MIHVKFLYSNIEEKCFHFEFYLPIIKNISYVGTVVFVTTCRIAVKGVVKAYTKMLGMKYCQYESESVISCDYK